MQEQLIRLPRVMELTGLKKSTIWAWSKEKKFPQPIKISNRVTVWKLSEIQEYIHNITNI